MRFHRLEQASAIEKNYRHSRLISRLAISHYHAISAKSRFRVISLYTAADDNTARQ